MTDESIAIVGASCRFPGADNLEGFWQLLASGGDAISEVDDQRWSTRFYYHPNRAEPGKSYTWAAGLVSGADLFGLIASVLICAYLLYALLRGEKF